LKADKRRSYIVFKGPTADTPSEPPEEQRRRTVRAFGERIEAVVSDEAKLKSLESEIAAAAGLDPVDRERLIDRCRQYRLDLQRYMDPAQRGWDEDAS
jgi:hypothetical protein